MVDALKSCSFTGSGGNLSLEFESPSGVEKSAVIGPKDLLQLMIEIKKITREANNNGENVSNENGIASFPSCFELYQYQFMCADDMSFMMLHFLTRDNTNFGFPLTKKHAKHMGKELLRYAEQLKKEDETAKLSLVRKE